MLLSVGAVPMLPVAKADAMSGEEQTVWTWVQNLVHKFQEMEFMDGSRAAALVDQLPITDSDKVSVGLWCVCDEACLDYAGKVEA